MDFPQQSHLFSNFKPKELSKSYFNHSIRNFEDDFYDLLERVRINDDVTIKEQTYADIFTLLGEFKLFAEETTRSFIFNLESIDQTSHDFKEMPENNDKGIETFTSEKLNVIIKCVLTQNNEIIKEPNLYNEEEENSICSFKRLGNLFKAYDYLINFF